MGRNEEMGGGIKNENEGQRGNVILPEVGLVAGNDLVLAYN